MSTSFNPNPSSNSGGRPTGVYLFLAVLGALIVVLFVVGIIPRIEQKKELKKAEQETVDAVRMVPSMIARPARSTESIKLPGNIDAILYTTIYARVDGYLKSRLVDIGDHVKTGQLLAVIDTPTVDEKLNQGRADLKEAQAGFTEAQAQLKEAIAQDVKAQAEIDKDKANLVYATVTAKRWIDLAGRGAVSLQSRDEKVRFEEAQTATLNAAVAAEKATAAQVKAAQSQVKVAEAKVVAQQANVRRLEAEQGFQKVVAPFEGIITVRKVDPGALITQGSQTTSLELFQLAKIEKLRIYVGVPQRVARYLAAGQVAQVDVPEFPEKKFIGHVSNVSGALDPNTRTRMTEVRMDNPDHLLLPGMYAEVKFSALRDTPWIRVPGTTIITRTDGLFVAQVKDNKVHFQKVTVGRDFGDVIEIRVGLNDGDEVIVSPPDDLREGEPIKTKPTEFS
jgi:RND family efflux transporter MFP subunit